MAILPRPELKGVLPSYHGGVTADEIRALGAGAVPEKLEVIDFSVNTNPLGPSPMVKAALADVDIQRYPDSEAVLLRQELSRCLGVGVGNLIVGNGSVEIIWLVCSAYLRRGDAALILGPTFGEYEVASRVFGGQVRFHLAREEDDFCPDLGQVVAAIEALRPRLVFVCNPNNPTGHLLAKEEIKRIVDSAASSLVVIDEAYLSLSDGDGGSEELAQQANVLVVRSMTKDYALAGLRVGYALADEEIIGALRRVRPPWSVNSFAQAAALAALRDEGHLERSREEIRAARKILIAGLAELGLKAVPSAANFLLVKVGDAAAFRSSLLRKGYCVRLCSSFGLAEYVRIGVRTQAECHDLLKAIREVPLLG